MLQTYSEISNTQRAGFNRLSKVSDLNILSSKYGICFMPYKTKLRFSSPQREGILPNLNAAGVHV